MKVYIVTSGEYSSYHIDRVFTDKKLANEYCRRLQKYNNYDFNGASVEVYSTDPDDDIYTNFDDETRNGRFFGYAIEKGGKFRVLAVTPMPLWYCEEMANDGVKWDVDCDNAVKPTTNTTPYITIFLKYLDTEKARKIAMDRVAKEKWESVERGEDV